MNINIGQWNLILAILVIVGAVGSPLFEWWVDPKKEPFDWRYMWFASGPSVLGVLQGTVITPIFTPDHAIIPQIIGALTAGAGLTRAATLLGRKAGIHPRKQEDIAIKEIVKEEKENGG